MMRDVTVFMTDEQMLSRVVELARGSCHVSREQHQVHIGIVE